MSTQERGIMERGTVKWFNDAKGFGFIVHETSGKDVFVHFSVIQSEGFRTLKDGELVEYELIDGPKGLNATKVIRVNPPTKASTSAAPISLNQKIEVIKTDTPRENSTNITEIEMENILSQPQVFGAQDEGSLERK